MRPARPIACRAFGLAVGMQLAVAEVVVVVSAAGPETRLSRTQIADIFLGKANRYPDGRRAIPIDQREGSAARASFYEINIGRSAAQIKAHWSKIIFTGRGQPPRQVADEAEAKRYLADHPGAITYLALDDVDASVRIVSPPESRTRAKPASSD